MYGTAKFIRRLFENRARNFGNLQICQFREVSLGAVRRCRSVAKSGWCTYGHSIGGRVECRSIWSRWASHCITTMKLYFMKQLTSALSNGAVQLPRVDDVWTGVCSIEEENGDASVLVEQVVVQPDVRGSLSLCALKLYLTKQSTLIVSKGACESFRVNSSNAGALTVEAENEEIPAEPVIVRVMCSRLLSRGPLYYTNQSASK